MLRRPRHTLALILVLALVLRVGAIALTSEYEPKQDSIDFDRHAQSIAAGHGFPQSGFAPSRGPSAFRAPLYPFALGGVYALTGDSVTAGRLMNAVLGVVTVLLMYLLAEALWGRGIGLLSALLGAVFPPLVLLTLALNTEPLFLVFELAAVLALVAYRRAGEGRLLLVASGVACALAALTRPNGLLLLIPVMLGVWTVSPRFSARALAAPAVVLLAALLTILPWTVRNAIVFDRVVPPTTQTGIALAGEYNHEARTYPGYPATWLLPLPQVVDGLRPIYARDLDEAELDGELTRYALRYARKHPGYVAEASALNTLRTFELWSRTPSAVRVDREQRGLSPRTAAFDRWSVWAAAALGMLGLVVLASRRYPSGEALYVWLAPILLLAVAFPLVGQPRYRAPILPFLVFLSAIALAWLVRRARSAPRRPALP